MSGLTAQLIAADVSTTITSLAAGVAGMTSNKLSQYLINAAGGSSNPSFGERGVQFVVRSTVTSIVFGVVAGYMPQTSQNVFFSLLFFNTNSGLMNDAVGLSAVATNAVINAIIKPSSMAARSSTSSTTTASATPSTSCAMSACAFSK